MQTPMELIAEGLQFPESPIWSRRDACLYLADWTGEAVLAYASGGLRSLFRAPGGPSGLDQDGSGNLWLTLYNSRRLAAYTPLGGLLGEWDSLDGAPFRGPCDLTCDARGGVYFTDSGDYEDDWRSGRAAGWVYHLSPPGPGGFNDRRLHRLAGPLHFPNGIALAPDGRALYVDEHRKNRTLRYKIAANGKLADPILFFTCDDACLLEPDECFELGPDGMCALPNGSLVIAHYGGGKVLYVNPRGELIRTFHLPRGRRPTSAAYNPAERALYITEAEFGLLYRITIE